MLLLCDVVVRVSAQMVWSREPEAERPPLSVILPRLYLGAESDVTQVSPAERHARAHCELFVDAQ